MTKVDEIAERGDYFSELSQRLLATSAALVKKTQGDCAAWKVAPPNARCRLGDDIDAKTLGDIEKLFSNRLGPVDSWREAQLRELAFWRWVAFEGYLNLPSELYPFHQEHFMLSTYFRTGWTRARFAGTSAFELGCGPLGMIEYLPASQRVAFDPLNAHYGRLFKDCRKTDIQYLSSRSDVEALEPKFGLAICHNVIDHTDDPAWWFNTLFRLLKIGGDFLFQVNLSRKSVPQPSEHVKMHPSPVTREQVHEWLNCKSKSFNYFEEDTASIDGEFYFLAWGTKTHDDPVSYINQAR